MQAAAQSQSETYAETPISPARPMVTPLCVFAAHRESFDVIVRTDLTYDSVIALLFELLPLEENGWDLMAASIVANGDAPDGFPIFRVSRI